jgi:DNA-binding PadR family transcriptional regulator
MSLRHALLGLLTDRPHTGWGLLKHFESSLAYAWPAGHSQIYPELARLRDAGLIEQTGTGARGAKTYEITPAGAHEVRRWLAEPRPVRGGRSDALLRVFFLWLLEPEQADEHLRREEEHLRALLGELEAIAAGERENTRKDRAYGLALEWGLRETRMRLEWAEWARAEVASPAWRDAPTG